MSGVEVILDNLETNPNCPHGPTLLFSRQTANNKKRNFFACSACRDRKLCSFYLDETERHKYNKALWDEERKRFIGNMNHRKLFQTLNQIMQVSAPNRGYCHSCNAFQLKQFWEKHKEHNLVTNISDSSLKNPSEFLVPLEESKKEAQFLFAKRSVEVIVDMFEQLNYTKVISLGTPRIHEFVTNTKEEMESILLDFDSRYHNFFGPLQFCWYNSFNNHFFHPESQQIFRDFLANDNLVLILDPPFGGRVEPLAYSLTQINRMFQKLHKTDRDLPVFWIFPYFMEAQILNSCPNFTMLDYKVDYDNHPLFQDGSKGRKYGSPVRIFTNVNPSKITLPSNGYKFCSICKKWVAEENQHCEICNNCTSKDGRTYVHCMRCQRCVKPSWQHCTQCERCCQPEHKCGSLDLTQNCFHCKESGHKKRSCPKINIKTYKKRKH